MCTLTSAAWHFACCSCSCSFRSAACHVTAALHPESWLAPGRPTAARPAAQCFRAAAWLPSLRLQQAWAKAVRPRTIAAAPPQQSAPMPESVSEQAQRMHRRHPLASAIWHCLVLTAAFRILEYIHITRNIETHATAMRCPPSTADIACSKAVHAALALPRLPCTSAASA